MKNDLINTSIKSHFPVYIELFFCHKSIKWFLNDYSRLLHLLSCTLHYIFRHKSFFWLCNIIIRLRNVTKHNYLYINILQKSFLKL